MVEWLCKARLGDCEPILKTTVDEVLRKIHKPGRAASWHGFFRKRTVAGWI